jgi:hypothetical protein
MRPYRVIAGPARDLTTGPLGGFLVPPPTCLFSGYGVVFELSSSAIA